MPKTFLVLCVSIFLFAGCRAVSHKETKDDAQSAVGSVVSGVSGKDIRAKYCPVCARHYGPRVLTCPIDGAKLEEIEE